MTDGRGVSRLFLKGVLKSVFFHFSPISPNFHRIFSRFLPSNIKRERGLGVPLAPRLNHAPDMITHPSYTSCPKSETTSASNWKVKKEQGSRLARPILAFRPISYFLKKKDIDCKMTKNKMHTFCSNF